ncbi:MAG: SelB C-terminal domain-containing protein, partial [Verrucomicrobiota bacterium]|nr:SelB C-terminal domain-containing protein [Verrucomicrobiota bacterium]
VESDPRAAGVFDALVDELCRSGFEQTGAALRRTTHRPELPPHLRAAGDKLRVVLAAKPLEPPSRKELAADPAAHQALRFLIQTGEAVEVGPELVLLAESFARARESVRAFLRAHTSATVSELRQALATNRRVIVPLLEHLDRTGVTLRQGDQRTLREPR